MIIFINDLVDLSSYMETKKTNKKVLFPILNQPEDINRKIYRNVNKYPGVYSQNTSWVRDTRDYPKIVTNVKSRNKKVKITSCH
jgi:hypothetical protein